MTHTALMATPTVSVLLTAFNREPFIGPAIESVLAQTFTDFELVVVDDCSTDRTVDVVRRYLSDPRVRLVQNERNRGDYPNRNHAATFARGLYLKYHDSDDVMYPHCLAAMVPPMLAYPEAAFGLSTGKNWPGGPCPMMLTPRMSYQREFLGSGLFNAGPSGAIFRAEALRALGGFQEVGSASDFLFWLGACARVPVLLLPADLFWYRIHPSQELRSERAAREYAVSVRAVWAALADEACPLTPEEREQARRNVIANQVKLLWRDVRARRYALARLRFSAGPGLGAWVRYLSRPRRDALAGTPLAADGGFVTPRSRPPHEGGAARMTRH